MSLIIKKCVKNWLPLAIDATKDPMKVGRMLTIQEFIKYTDFQVDQYSIDKFYYNLRDDLFIYVDNSIIEWFGYQDNIKKKKKLKKYYKKIFHNIKIYIGLD